MKGSSFVDSLPCDELSTHAQLLYHKKTITELLLKNLQDEKCKSVQAFCELLSAFVLDMKEDFRDDMWDFFSALTNVLDLGERDVESVEAAFFTLSLLVRIMWRTLIKDFVSFFCQVHNMVTGVFKISDPDIRDYGVTILEKTTEFIVKYVQKASRGDLFFFEVTLIEPTLSARLLNLYSSICLKKRPIQDALSRSRAPIFDVAHHLCVKQHVVELIPRFTSAERSLNAAVLVIWPWVFDVSEPISGTEEVAAYLKELVSGDDYSLEASQLALLAASSIFQVDKSLLRMLNPSEVERFVRVSDLLTPCYFNPKASIRKCALEILNSFNFSVEGTKEEDMKHSEGVDENVFAILLAAECCNIIDSRGRLLQFHKLMFGAHKRFMPKDSRMTYDHIILRISFAQFFVQFTKLWPSMYEILESFARGMAIDDFWTVMVEIIDQVNSESRQHEKKESTTLFLPWCDKDDRFDYSSARIEIFKFMAIISDLAQRRTRILSPIVLKIYESEYLPLIVESLSSLSKGSQLESADTEDMGVITAKESPDTNYEQRMHATKALCSLLDVYAKFNDAKSVYLEKKIRSMYEHLLMVGNDMVQKSALSCIFSYRDKGLLPYKENFERLLDEKSFREQLVLFTINEEDGNSIVHPDHRQTVMHILLRFLYGKLWTQTKRNFTESRRAAIFRYLGGCRPEELLDFLKILFAPVLDVIGTEEMDYSKMDLLCADSEVLFRMDLGKISRCYFEIY
ncbi:Down-regulated in metastasis [Ostertagia ostertagi]